MIQDVGKEIRMIERTVTPVYESNVRVVCYEIMDIWEKCVIGEIAEIGILIGMSSIAVVSGVLINSIRKRGDSPLDG